MKITIKKYVPLVAVGHPKRFSVKKKYWPAGKWRITEETEQTSAKRASTPYGMPFDKFSSLFGEKKKEPNDQRGREAVFFSNKKMCRPFHHRLFRPLATQVRNTWYNVDSQAGNYCFYIFFPQKCPCDPFRSDRPKTTHATSSAPTKSESGESSP